MGRWHQELGKSCLEELTIHGPRGTLLWGYRDVAGLRFWRIYKQPRLWLLTASLERANLFEVQAGARCRELHFTAPRDKGRWCWPIVECSTAASELRATLGPPLQ